MIAAAPLLLLTVCVSTPGHTALFGAGSALYDRSPPPTYEPDFAPVGAPQMPVYDPEPMRMPTTYPAQFNGVPLDGSPQGRPGCPGIPLPGSNYCVVQ
jgi:hypothetical protein